MKRRLAFGIPLLAAVFAVALLDISIGSMIGSAVILSLLVGLGVVEYFTMLAHAGLPGSKTIGSSVGIAVFGFHAWMLAIEGRHISVAIIALFVVLAAITFRALQRGAVATFLEEAAFTIFGVFWVAILGGYLLELASLGVEVLLFVVLVTKFGDIGAFFTGSLIGRHKLVPRVSPGKTIEGSIGGLCLAVVVSAIASRWLVPSLGVIPAVVLGVVLNVATQLGDLAESLVKRRLDCKDSASLIPAFGGVLDLIDSLLFTAPCAYLWLTSM